MDDEKKTRSVVRSAAIYTRSYSHRETLVQYLTCVDLEDTRLISAAGRAAPGLIRARRSACHSQSFPHRRSCTGATSQNFPTNSPPSVVPRSMFFLSTQTSGHWTPRRQHVKLALIFPRFVDHTLDLRGVRRRTCRSRRVFRTER